MDIQKPKRLSYSSLILGLLISCWVFSQQAQAKSDSDPLEPINRTIFSINDVLDKFILKPTAVVYQAVMPEFAERGVRNFFSNLGEVRNVVHNGLQGKMDGVAQSGGRFVINSTLGIGGLFDVASKMGIDSAREDLGQTLGAWGLNSGPYLVLPILGPSSLRDSTGVFVDPFLSPITHTELSLSERSALSVINGLQTRADLIAAEGLLSGDKYVLYREAYLSKREFDVNDGQVLVDDFVDDDPFSDDLDGFVDEAF